MHKPDDMSTTIVISDQLCVTREKEWIIKIRKIYSSVMWRLTFFSSPNNIAKKQMNIIVVDLVIV